MNNKIVYWSKPDRNKGFKRSHYIIYTSDRRWHFGDFNTKEQVDELAKLLGFTYTLTEQKPDFEDEDEIYEEYLMDREIVDDMLFWGLDEVEGYTPFKALSNGSVSTCYFKNDGEKIFIKRPNPNARVYDPMSVDEHKAYQKAHGSY